MLSFILNRAVRSFGAKFMRKYILGKEFTKTIVKFKISAHEHHFVLGLIEKKAFRSFGNKFVPQKNILGTEFTKAIIKFGINILECAFVPSFSSNNAL